MRIRLKMEWDVGHPVIDPVQGFPYSFGHVNPKNEF